MTNLSYLVISSNRTYELSIPLQHKERTIVEVPPQANPVYKILLITYFSTKKLAYNDVDVIITNGPGLLSLPPTVVSFVFSTQHIIRIRGDLWKLQKEKIEEYKDDSNRGKYYKQKIRGVLKMISFNFADGYIAVSEDVKECTIQNTGISAERVGVVPPAIPVTEYCNIERDYTRNTERIKLLTVTDLEYSGKRKGLREVLQSFDSLSTPVDTELYIACDGSDYYDEIEGEINNLKNKDNIHLLGHVSKIRNLYAMCDVFVYISYIDGYPNVVQEAKCSGLPIITNYDLGMKEQIVDQETGLFVKEDGIQNITQQMELLLRNPDLRKQLGTNAQNDMIDNRNSQECSKRLEKEISNIMSAPKS